MVNPIKNLALNSLQKQSKDLLDQLLFLLKEIRESQDETTLAIVSVYNNQKAIAEHLKISLPDPLTKMEIEK